MAGPEQWDQNSNEQLLPDQSFDFSAPLSPKTLDAIYHEFLQQSDSGTADFNSPTQALGTENLQLAVLEDNAINDILNYLKVLEPWMKEVCEALQKLDEASPSATRSEFARN
ncbi:hypothetical protein EMCG_05067 [[Emmonsia] crescens]|uniref:Uncharacterized protein n=1 Tax=[Emmonsia] crescens TaxID=73230 RepID=A0A0G2HR27_9EURO|nr:hypothetical protein EMCG_05067 [Emmonsia crescens UAMH 3008]